MPDRVLQFTPPKDTMTFALFSAANPASVYLLDKIRSEISPPALIRHKKSTGYHLTTTSSSECKDNLWRIGAGPPAKITEKKLDHIEPDILL